MKTEVVTDNGIKVYVYYGHTDNCYRLLCKHNHYNFSPKNKFQYFEVTNKVEIFNYDTLENEEFFAGKDKLFLFTCPYKKEKQVLLNKQLFYFNKRYSLPSSLANKIKQTIESMEY